MNNIPKKTQEKQHSSAKLLDMLQQSFAKGDTLTRTVVHLPACREEELK